MIKIDKSIVEKITWEQDPDSFDQRLHALGSSHDEFVIVNPKYEWILDYIDVDQYTSNKCIVWSIDNLWLVKKFKSTWTVDKGWDFINCKLDLEKEITINPEVDFVDYDIDFTIPIEDMYYEHVFYLDEKHNPGDDKIWVAKCKIKDQEIHGIKDRGYVSPIINIERNPALPNVDYNINLEIPYYDFKYDLTWYLDPAFNTFDDKIWVFKVNARNSLGLKDMGYVMPEVEPRIEFNSSIPNIKYDLDINVSFLDLVYEHVWYLDPKFNPLDEDVWAVKLSTSDLRGSKSMGYVSPVIERNPDFTSSAELLLNEVIPYYEFKNNLVWYLDSKFNNTDDNIWALRINSLEPDAGVKDMGYVTPNVTPTITFNPGIPNIKYDLDINVAFLDLVYEHVWYLDPKFNPTDENIWAVKLSTSDLRGTKSMGYVSPVIERNPEIPAELLLNEVIPYYEFKNNLVWYLDPKFNPTDENIWTLRINSLEPDAGVKDMGYVSPEFIFNPDIPAHLDYFIHDKIPYYDLGYEHVWMLDSNLHTDNEQIWAAKIVPNIKSLGTKIVGNIGVISKDFDVVFISYNEPNAEANWYRVLELFPNAKRVKNVKGIFEAHKRAAEIATTDMFYVVDGDAELVDNWQFDYKPNVFDLDCVHLWTSINPINDLEYGWGGVKLFPRKLLLDAETWKVDLTTGLGKLKYINKVSNVTSFNSDEFGTWRSAFRECAKLSSSLYQGTTTYPETEERLRIWTTVGKDRRYGEYALHGAALGKQYGLDHFNNLDALKLINNYEWMKNEFDKFYKH